MLQPLLPIKLTKDDPSYKTVEELAEVLDYAIKNKDIRNVALTGPFGSGKSSIIQTLMEEHNEFNYLSLSLATLQADSEGKSAAEAPLPFFCSFFSTLQPLNNTMSDAIITNPIFFMTVLFYCLFFLD